MLFLDINHLHILGRVAVNFVVFLETLHSIVSCFGINFSFLGKGHHSDGFYYRNLNFLQILDYWLIVYPASCSFDDKQQMFLEFERKEEENSQ